MCQVPDALSVNWLNHAHAAVPLPADGPGSYPATEHAPWVWGLSGFLAPALAIILINIVLGSVAQAAGPADANTLGYRAYKAGDYEKAVELFVKAAQDSPSSALAYYNLACTRAVLRKRDGPCANDRTTLEDIVKDLDTSIRLDPRRKKRALADADLSVIHRTFYFRKLKGFRSGVDAELERLLLSVDWFGPLMSGFKLRFLSGGKAQWKIYDGLIEGTYRVKGGRVHLSTSPCSPKKTVGCGVEEELSFKESTLYASVGHFMDIPDECSTP